jgi:hypothetical protein
VKAACSTTKLFSSACRTENISGITKAASSKKFWWESAMPDTFAGVWAVFWDTMGALEAGSREAVKITAMA